MIARDDIKVGDLVYHTDIRHRNGTQILLRVAYVAPAITYCVLVDYYTYNERDGLKGDVDGYGRHTSAQVHPRDLSRNPEVL